jgi:uncharacterized protein YyaL (SSP411 family)
LDDKVLASWNGTMIGAFARASWVLQDPALVEYARRAADFVLTKLVDQTSWTLRRRYREGEARFDGQLDDYMGFAAGLLTLFQTTGEGRWLNASVALTEQALSMFADPSSGALFDSPGTDPSVLVRMREHYDGAEPAGNSLAAVHLLRLSHLTGEDRWRERAMRILEAYSPELQRQPATLPYMLAALDLYYGEAVQILITGKRDDPTTLRLLSVASSAYLPSAAIVLLDGSEDQRDLLDRLPWVGEHQKRGRVAHAFVCRDFRCELPTAAPEVLARLLKEGGA